ncbi:lipoprotein signal peptidase [Pseudomonas sp. PvP001]
MPDSSASFGRYGHLKWLWLSVLVMALDQATKFYFDGNLQMYEQIVVIPDLLSWTLAYNTGAAFSFLADSGGWQRWLFTLIAVVVSVVLVVWLKRLGRGDTWLAIALALVLGGAVGNLFEPRRAGPCGRFHSGALAGSLAFPGVQPGRQRHHRRCDHAGVGYVQEQEKRRSGA